MDKSIYKREATRYEMDHNQNNIIRHEEIWIKRHLK